MARNLIVAITCGLAWLATASTAYAQRNDSYDPSTGISGRCVSNCDPEPNTVGSGGYTADQQAMLNLAGNLGSLFGGMIRQSFVDGERQAEAEAQRRAYEAEQARQRAMAEEAERQRRNQALLANMKGAVGSFDLRPSQLGSGQLKMRTAKDMFDGSIDAQAAALAPGSWSAYYNVLQRRDVAAVALNARESDLVAAQRLVAEAERNAVDHSGPEADRILAEARALRDKAQRARDTTEGDLRQLDVKLAEAAAARDKALNASADAGAQSTPGPAPGASVSQTANQTGATAPAGQQQSSTQQLASRLPRASSAPGGVILNRGPQYSDPNAPASTPGAAAPVPGAAADTGTSQQQEVFLGGVKPADAGLESASTTAPRPDDLNAFAESLHIGPDRPGEDEGDYYARMRQARMVKTIAASTRDWDAIERQRLSEALRKLSRASDVDVTAREIRNAWMRMYYNDKPEIVAAAAKGAGPALSAKGLQVGSTCALYALANASGRSYEEVLTATRAIIRQGLYRGNHDKPDWVVQNLGIYGEELVMLVEALGAVDIVQPTAFAETLRAGRAVMVSVVADPGEKYEDDGLHQVVLSRTFEYNGATWFEVIDSNSVVPRYVSKADLDLILMENGITYRPEQRAPHLLP